MAGAGAAVAGAGVNPVRKARLEMMHRLIAEVDVVPYDIYISHTYIYIYHIYMIYIWTSFPTTRALLCCTHAPL